MTALRVFTRVVWALVKREAVTRNGKMRFGYIWAFMEPAVYIAGIVVFRSLIMDRVPFGENAVLYLATALLTFRTAMSLARRVMGAIGSNIALLTFPQVKTFDVILARILLEVLTWVGITMFFILGLYFVAGLWAVALLENFLAGFCATIFFGASIGFFNATFVRIFPFWDRVFALASLPLLVASGVFYLPQNLPPEALHVLWWNPYLHLVEWVRSGVYLDYTPFLSPSYVLGLSSLLLLAGLFINKYYQDRLLQD